MTPNKKVLLNIWTSLKEKKGRLAVIKKYDGKGKSLKTRR